MGKKIYLASRHTVEELCRSGEVSCFYASSIPFERLMSRWCSVQSKQHQEQDLGGPFPCHMNKKVGCSRGRCLKTEHVL